MIVRWSRRLFFQLVLPVWCVLAGLGPWFSHWFYQVGALGRCRRSLGGGGGEGGGDFVSGVYFPSSGTHCPEGAYFILGDIFEDRYRSYNTRKNCHGIRAGWPTFLIFQIWAMATASGYCLAGVPACWLAGCLAFWRAGWLAGWLAGLTLACRLIG